MIPETDKKGGKGQLLSWAFFVKGTFLRKVHISIDSRNINTQFDQTLSAAVSNFIFRSPDAEHSRQKQTNKIENRVKLILENGTQ